MEPVADLSGADDSTVWRAALAYVDRGMPFHAHEVFEARWRTCDEPDRDAWRALAQWGAALTHAARGNSEGARRLAERAAATLYAARAIPEGIDTALVLASCAEISDIGL